MTTKYILNQGNKIMAYMYDEENLKSDDICPECGGKAVIKTEDYGLNLTRQGLFSKIVKIGSCKHVTAN